MKYPSNIVATVFLHSKEEMSINSEIQNTFLAYLPEVKKMAAAG